MKKFLVSMLLLPAILGAAGPAAPSKPAASAPKKQEQSIPEPSILEEAVKLYKNSESARTALKNQIISTYNTLTNSDSFQLGKCAVGGVMLYYGMKQLQSLTSPIAAPNGLDVQIAEKKPKQIYSFLKNSDKFKKWLKEPVTKAGIKIVAGTILLKKPTMELVALYNRAVKKFL